MERDVDRVTSERRDGEHVGAQRVADHHEPVGPHAVALDDAAVGRLVLLGNDLNALETLGEAGPGELALLVEQVALRDDHQAVAIAELVDRFDDAVEQLDWVRQHRLAGVEDCLDDRRRHAAL